MNINMKCLSALAIAAVSLAVLPSCGNKQTASDKSAETVTDTATKDSAAAVAVADTGITAEPNDEAAQAADAKVVEDFLNKLYKDYVFGSRDFAKAKSQFAGSIVKRLRAEYEFEGGGYAVWLFRTASQDGASDKSEVKSISSDGDGWYTVKYSDMGNAGSTRFKVTVTDGTAYVEDFKPDKSHS